MNIATVSVVRADLASSSSSSLRVESSVQICADLRRKLSLSSVSFGSLVKLLPTRLTGYVSTWSVS